MNRFKNEDFYTDGKFNRDKAVDAIVALCTHYGYSMGENFRQDLWVSDYGLGEYARVGLAAIILLNDEEGQYLGLDIFLLPDQMLAEHYHLATAKCPAKLEGWIVRNGISYVYGEGEPTQPIHAVIPESQQAHVTVYHEVVLQPGEATRLNRREARHWQFAGPEGAIISEVGSFHDGDAVRHTCPQLVL